jgi:uncharacterized small protein (DUF1192 family)
MRLAWDALAQRWPDLVIATVLAAILAVLVDLLRVSSRLREGGRWVKDKLAKSSIAELNRRIAEQEKYRATLQSYLNSDKTFYVAILRSMVGVLLFMCVAGMVLIIGRLGAMAFPVAEFMALGVLAVAIVAGISTMQLGSFDASKISELIRNLDAELVRLKEARSQLEKTRNIVK